MLAFLMHVHGLEAEMSSFNVKLQLYENSLIKKQTLKCRGPLFPPFMFTENLQIKLSVKLSLFFECTIMTSN